MPAAVTRRSFLVVLGLAAAPGRAPAAPRLTELLRCPVAGLRYHDYARVAARVVAGTRLVLRREPANPHDAKAIGVFTEDAVKLGYVPRIDNAALASLMDAGHELRAAVVAAPGSPIWNAVQIAVTLVGERVDNLAT